MVFAHDTEVALNFAVALVNTAREDPDPLATPESLEAFIGGWEGWTGSRTHDERELAAVRALRPRLRALWETGEDGAVELVNELLREGPALPQLVRHGDWGWHVHATPPEAEFAVRIAVEAGLGVADVIRAGEFDRLRTCAADDCEDALVDLSRNRSKRFCNSTCANRMNVAAYRARQRG